MLHIAACIFFAVAAGTPTIAAADRLWTSVGDGCVPVDEDIVVNNYDSRGFGVGFKGTATGDIRLVCPVNIRTSGASPTVNELHMSYKDPDGTGGNSRIRSTLWQVSDGSNAASSLCTADSNSNSPTGNTTWSCLPFAFVPSLSKSYYVEIIIERTTSTLDPELLAVWLD